MSAKRTGRIVVSMLLLSCLGATGLWFAMPPKQARADAKTDCEAEMVKTGQQLEAIDTYKETNLMEYYDGTLEIRWQAMWDWYSEICTEWTEGGIWFFHPPEGVRQDIENLLGNVADEIAECNDREGWIYAYSQNAQGDVTQGVNAYQNEYYVTAKYCYIAAQADLDWVETYQAQHNASITLMDGWLDDVYDILEEWTPE